MRSFLCFKVIYKVKGDFQGHLGQKVAAKIDFLDFSFIVLISWIQISIFQQYEIIGVSLILTRELHGDGDLGNPAVTTVTPR